MKTPHSLIDILVHPPYKHNNHDKEKENSSFFSERVNSFPHIQMDTIKESLPFQYRKYLSRFQKVLKSIQPHTTLLFMPTMKSENNFLGKYFSSIPFITFWLARSMEIF
jgi:hypothetical protein